MEGMEEGRKGRGWGSEEGGKGRVDDMCFYSQFECSHWVLGCPSLVWIWVWKQRGLCGCSRPKLSPFSRQCLGIQLWKWGVWRGKSN